jgi:serine/threonine protein kinase
MCAVVSRSQGQIAASVAALPVSEACKEWLGLALQKDPSKRATAAQLRQHRWLATEAQQQQQPATMQPQHVDCSQPSMLLQCCTSDDYPAAAAMAAVNSHNSSSSSFTGGNYSSNGFNQQGPPQASNGWQAAAAPAAVACSTQSTSSCATAAGRLANGTGSVGSCSASGGVSGMSQQQFASYLQTIGSWED